MQQITTTQNELFLNSNDIIITKTDLNGHITYANRAFMRMTGLPEHALLGKQYTLIRHPDMPRGLFKLLWETVQQGDEFFGYLKNSTVDGRFYWGFANVTLDKDYQGQVSGYFSVWRKPDKTAIETIQKLYEEMLEIEQRTDSKTAAIASVEWLHNKLKEDGTSYERYVLSLMNRMMREDNA